MNEYTKQVVRISAEQLDKEIMEWAFKENEMLNLPGPRVYISGPITASTEQDKGKARFKEQVLRLHAYGYIPISPRRHRVPPWLDIKYDQDKIWPYMMKLAIKDLMDADCCVMLDGWDEGSKGCFAEYRLCRLLNIPVYDERYHLIKVHDFDGMCM